MAALVTYPKIVVLGLCLLLCGQGAQAAEPFASSDNLDRLETKFFHHTYETQSTDTRLARLEQLVFGTVRNGTRTDRVARLVAATSSTSFPTAQAVSRPVPPVRAAPRQPPATLAAGRRTQLTRAGPARLAQMPKPGKAPPMHGIVQHHQPSGPSSAPARMQVSLPEQVSALERQVLGREYAGQSLLDRVSRLERVTYPHLLISRQEPLLVRVDRLQSEVALAHRSGHPVRTYEPAVAGSAPAFYDRTTIYDYRAPSTRPPWRVRLSHAFSRVRRLAKRLWDSL